MITIRPETAEDYATIREVTLLAFGQEDEARLVEDLRRLSDFIPELSLVALRGEQVVGHILFSPLVIETAKGPVPALSLAPMSVRPECQNQGVGSQLVREGLKRCRSLGHEVVVVIGHPDYYPSFGFSSARAKGLEAPFEVPDEAFLVLELAPGALAGIAGVIKYPPPFNI
jgi:putative acetyltransferase